MDTCLLTDETLGPTTRLEHTIPAKLGGRIRSRTVASDALNSCCGSTIDRDVIATYWMMMMSLAPLLSTEHQPGEHEVRLPSHPGRYIVDSRGTLSPKGTTITARDPKTKRPMAAAARDPEAILRVLEQSKPPNATIQEVYEPPVTSRAKLPQSQLISPQIELAVLKAGLLSFDALLPSTTDRFTRSPALQELRQTMRALIIEGADAGQFLGAVSMGIQYEKVDPLRKLRNQIDFPRSDFEHILIASANAPTRTLDLVVWLFEMDPYGFRLTAEWPGDGFTYIVVNGVLRGTEASEVMQLPSTHLLCRPTIRRAAPSQPLTETDRRAAAQEIIDVRADALRRASHLTLQKSDEFVQKALSEAALPSGDRIVTIPDVVRSKLAQLYEQRLEDRTARNRFDGIVDRHFKELSAELKEEVVKQQSDLDGLSWGVWIPLFRTIVDDLCAEFGLPGDFEMSIAAVGP